VAKAPLHFIVEKFNLFSEILLVNGIGNTTILSVRLFKKIFLPSHSRLKIDVDGIEHLILRGGEKVLSNTKELLIEINEQFTKQTSESSKLLNDLGFILKEKKRSDLFDKTEFSSSYNQIWVKKT